MSSLAFLNDILAPELGPGVRARGAGHQKAVLGWSCLGWWRHLRSRRLPLRQSELSWRSTFLCILIYNDIASLYFLVWKFDMIILHIIIMVIIIIIIIITTTIIIIIIIIITTTIIYIYIYICICVCIVILWLNLYSNGSKLRYKYECATTEWK